MTTLRWILAMIFAAIVGGGIASVVTAILLTGGWTLMAQSAFVYACIYGMPATLFWARTIDPFLDEIDERRGLSRR